MFSAYPLQRSAASSAAVARAALAACDADAFYWRKHLDGRRALEIDG
jgi:hypothetical protein